MRLRSWLHCSGLNIRRKRCGRNLLCLWRAFYLARAGERHIGFAQCALRHDYVEGTSTSPVGYLEGIYVLEEYRREGVAVGLLTACENWARQSGCKEFASDCELDNTLSLRFHLAVGFEEANRIICFAKKL